MVRRYKPVPLIKYDYYYRLSLNAKVKYNEKIVTKRFRWHISKRLRSDAPENSQSRLKKLQKQIFTRYHEIRKRSYEQPPKIKKLLNYIIPNSYFGSKCNRKRFYLVVDRLLTQSKLECIHYTALYQNYVYEDIPWLDSGDPQKDRTSFMEANIFLLDFVVKPLVKFYYVAVHDFKTYTIRMVPKSKWRSFQHRILNSLIKLGYLELVPKEKANKCLVTGILKLLPKNNLESLEYRPIITLRDKCIDNTLKHRIDMLIRRNRKATGFPPRNSLYFRWLKYVKEVGDKEIFGIKLDLQDAFGNADIQKLCDIVLKTEKKYFPLREQEHLVDMLTNQYISYGKNVYKWRHGLLQGARLSTRLCNLYITALERELKPYFTSGRFYFRTADDIFFCSTSSDDVSRFECDVKRLYIVNESKTIRCVEKNGNDKIHYLGKIFNLRTKEVKNLYSFDKRTEIRNRFKFWNTDFQISPTDRKGFIENSLKFFNSRPRFTKYEFNTIFNSPETVLENVFESMCYLAFKLDAAVTAIVYTLANNKNFVGTVLTAIKFIIQNHCPRILFYTQIYRGDKEKAGAITYTLLKLDLRDIIRDAYKEIKREELRGLNFHIMSA